MKYILEARQIKDLVFIYIERALGDIRPLDEKRHEGWSGYTNDFCERNDTFLWGYKDDDVEKDYLIIYYWGKAFEVDGICEMFNLERGVVSKYIKEYIQQFYDKPIRLC